MNLLRHLKHILKGGKTTMSITDADLGGDRTIEGAWRLQTGEDPGFVVASEAPSVDYATAFRVDSADHIGLVTIDTGGELVIVAADPDSAGLRIEIPSGHNPGPMVRIHVEGQMTDVFRIDADGTVHIKSGGSIVADL
jgi:hypothetical protein